MINYNFIPGLTLNRNFYFEIVKPLIESGFPELEYSASLIGYGSDVLGYDNPTSMDHNWGPRCQLFLNRKNISMKKDISEYLSGNLPFEFMGFPTNFTDPRTDFTQKMMESNSNPINHLIEIEEPVSYFSNYLGVKNIYDLNEESWIQLSDQALLELTDGEVFHDGLNVLNDIRSKLSFYPDTAYKIRLSSLWMAIANEEPFIGRCLEVKDFIGLRIIASRITNTLLKILFYIEKKYVPYSKWFGTRLKSLIYFKEIDQLVNSILWESNPAKINTHLGKLYQKIVAIHNKQSDLPNLDNKLTDFYGRPYVIINAESISEKLLDGIDNGIIEKFKLENVAMDLKVDSVDYTEN